MTVVEAIMVVVAVAALSLMLLVVLSACTVSGNISEQERRQENSARLGFAQVGETEENKPKIECPIDNNRLSLGQTGIEDDNAD